jgi:hypothetical protein
MDDAVNGRVLLEDFVERSFIGNINLVKEWTTAAEKLDPVESDGR